MSPCGRLAGNVSVKRGTLWGSQMNFLFLSPDQICNSIKGLDLIRASFWGSLPAIVTTLPGIWDLWYRTILTCLFLSWVALDGWSANWKWGWSSYTVNNALETPVQINSALRKKGIFSHVYFWNAILYMSYCNAVWLERENGGKLVFKISTQQYSFFPECMAGNPHWWEVLV